MDFVDRRCKLGDETLSPDEGWMRRVRRKHKRLFRRERKGVRRYRASDRTADVRETEERLKEQEVLEDSLEGMGEGSHLLKVALEERDCGSHRRPSPSSCNLWIQL